MDTGYCIDIDDTLIAFDPDYQGKHSTSSLLDILKLAATRLAGLSAAEAARITGQVQLEVNWWSWSDFLAPLSLEPGRFWDFAYETEKTYLKPAEPGLADHILRLKASGMRLYITSNNPQDGIRHKLRLAGVPADLFDDIYGATKLRAMKWETQFWQQVVERSGISPQRLITVGDDFRDDWQIPAQIGLGKCFLVNRDGRNNGKGDDGVQLIKTFEEIA